MDTEKTKILIVDDYRSHRLLLNALLEKAGYGIVMAASAQEAYECLGLAHPQQRGNGIELILMDIFMPETDGLTACARIKKEPHLRDIPLLIVTTGSAEENISEAMDCGSVGFLRKPICEPELVAHVRLALNWKREVEHSREIASELAHTNKILGESAVAVFHGLMESLRKMISLGVILQTCRAAAPGEADLPARILRAADHMEAHLDKLLTLAFNGAQPAAGETHMEEKVRDRMEGLPK